MPPQAESARQDMNPYKTLLKPGTGFYEEKRSRFIARATPVSTEEEALAHIRAVRTLDWDAGHHCHAYALDGSSTIRRCSDDGEPSGTAGVPILEVLNKQGITNAVIVVSRWFGGTLLGASGLLRAYGRTAGLGVSEAGTMLVKPCLETVLAMEYTLAGRVAHYLAAGGYLTAGTEYGEDVRIRLFLEPERQQVLERDLADLTSARVRILFSDPQPVAFSESGTFLRVMAPMPDA
jgi:uncharacterized YigZ family protein